MATDKSRDTVHIYTYTICTKSYFTNKNSFILSDIKKTIVLCVEVFTLHRDRPPSLILEGKLLCITFSNKYKLIQKV